MSQYPVKRDMDEYFAYLLKFGTMVAFTMLKAALDKAERDNNVSDLGRTKVIATLIGFASFDIK